MASIISEIRFILRHRFAKRGWIFLFCEGATVHGPRLGGIAGEQASNRNGFYIMQACLWRLIIIVVERWDHRVGLEGSRSTSILREAAIIFDLGKGNFTDEAALNGNGLESR
jgi:hypothetical protein